MLRAPRNGIILLRHFSHFERKPRLKCFATTGDLGFEEQGNRANGFERFARMVKKKRRMTYHSARQLLPANKRVSRGDNVSCQRHGVDMNEWESKCGERGRLCYPLDSPPSLMLRIAGAGLGAKYWKESGGERGFGPGQVKTASAHTGHRQHYARPNCFRRALGRIGHPAVATVGRGRRRGLLGFTGGHCWNHRSPAVSYRSPPAGDEPWTADLLFPA